MPDKQNGIFEKIENTVSVFLLIFLCILPLIQLITERFFRIPLLGAEGATVNLVFCLPALRRLSRGALTNTYV